MAMRLGREWAVEKPLIQLGFFEQGDRQDLEKSVERDLQAEALLDDGDEHVDRHGEVVGQEDEHPAGFRVPVLHPP